MDSQDEAEQARDRRSVLPWPALVRSGPGRWTLVASWGLVVAIAVIALVVVIVSM